MSPAPPALRTADRTLPRRLARSALWDAAGAARAREWIAERNAAHRHDVRRIPFDELRSWAFDPATGNLRHDTGRFFSVEGLQVHTDHGPVRSWSQPIINQPEIGILGILMAEIDGVLHCLLQAKTEPGNVNGVQLSPTVQATRSNYTGVHAGNAVPYLEYFRNPGAGRVLSDVLQSEQGSWFYRKRNRNMVVEVEEPFEAHEDFRWIPLGQVHELCAVDNIVNMDTRTVLAGMPTGFEGMAGTGSGGLADALARSCVASSGGLHTDAEVLSWITDRQSGHEIRTELIPLHDVAHWRRTPDRIRHDPESFFSVIAVAVTATSREVGSWTQPLLEPHGVGRVALLVARFGGVLHALMHARVEPGYLEAVELAPTVQFAPETYRGLGLAPPAFLDVVEEVGRGERVLFDAGLSEEGGRFHHARNRYQIIEVDPVLDDRTTPDHRWLTVAQLNGLLLHNNYVNVQARSLIACLRGLA
ncbi:NDP-hexose 2,3-dehydratase family protein [Pseudonocardia sp. HH130630-07]|uniref:NDP-hexose 2,3-dehydratase family protein n=1 Tax=Pseudonocardia sp. HH130630-07 TaxID=1690815 RepID=UPI0008150EA6|nr:NDP-hexose 2,3-dehydratase family protein [Pseudonocardia sp. HH130630-07]ANY10592.1 NDP-hexose 2,3-dehydratase [Pseudonocardia sp. HH130630-07]